MKKAFGKKEIIISIVVLIIIAIVSLIYLSVLKPGESGKNEVKVYFSKIAGSKVVTEAVTRKLVPGQSPISQAITALMEGPTKEEGDKYIYSEIPQGTRIINIKETPEEVRINLNEQFTSGGGSNTMQARLNEIVDTALENEPIRKVYLDIDGEQLEVLGGEGIEVSQPLSKKAANEESMDEEVPPANM